MNKRALDRKYPDILDMIKVGENIFYNKEACVNCHILNASDGGNNQLTKEHIRVLKTFNL